jgi:hypothetical protein
VELARKLGLPADYRMRVGTEAVTEAEHVAAEIAKEFPRSIFFMGKLIFQNAGFFYRVLHNNTADQLQQRLQFAGLNAMLLPIRAMDLPRAA